jgi:hypothetical protein
MGSKDIISDFSQILSRCQQTGGSDFSADLRLRHTDPLIGLHEQSAIFTIPKEPVCERIFGIQASNILKGGEYLFMPSLPARLWIAELRTQAGTR